MGIYLDKHTLDNVKKIYPKGAKVEAVRVDYIPKGMSGIIWDIKTSGDLVVRWSNGDTSIVVRGVDSIRVVREGYCILGYRPENCEDGHCKECGWNDKVHKERIRRIRENDFKEKDGVKRLIVKKSLVPVAYTK